MHALEVGPTEQEYGTSVTGGRIAAYSDAECVYNKEVADRLTRIAADRELAPQAAALRAFESDASHAKASGLTPRAGLLCLPTLSTGFEVMARSAIDAVAAIVADFLLRPDSDNGSDGRSSCSTGRGEQCSSVPVVFVG